MFRLLFAILLGLLLGLAGPALADDDDKNGEPEVVIFGPPPPEPPAVVARDEQGRVTLRAIRLNEPLVLDGKLDDDIYRRVPAVSDFIQQEPHEGELATEQTDAWVFFDDKNVYISARCWDSHPERMIVNEMRRDNRNIFQNEHFTVVLDTFYDRRNGFFFQTNPLGALRDQSVQDEGQSNNNDWNTVWDVKASMFDQGWIMEMVIPFKSLRYKTGRSQIWGINLKRTVRWKNEESFLAPIAASHRFRGVYRFSDAATLVGVEAPLHSRNLELKPYGITSVVTNNDADPVVSNDASADAGFDAKVGLTKGLIADFTYNTDFSQVEEDEQQVNLTRFSLFFPEKRDFFLEGQGIFAFGGVQLRGGFRGRPGRENEELTPILFFSRRIGLTEGGIDPIRAGGRVTGRAGAFRIGALNIRTRGIPAAELEATNFSVLRLRRDVLRRSDIGIMATHRNTSETLGATSNSVFGVDGNFSFLQNVRINTYYAVSRTPHGEADLLAKDETSYLGKMDFNGDLYGLQLEHLKVGQGFKPEIGFVRREAFRRNFVRGRFSPRPLSIQSVRRFVFQGDFDNIENLGGRLETRRSKAQFKIEFEVGDETTVEYTRSFEFLPEEFEISDGVILPVAEYDFQDVRFIYRFGPQRAVPGFVTFRMGSLFSGDRKELTYRARVEISPKFSIEPALSLNFVDLPEGDFTARLLTARFNWTLSPRMFVSSLVQYNSSASSLGSSLRFRWEYEPGSDLFVVYTDGRLTDVAGFPILLNRTFAVKMTKLFRF